MKIKKDKLEKIIEEELKNYFSIDEISTGTVKKWPGQAEKVLDKAVTDLATVGKTRNIETDEDLNNFLEELRAKLEQQLPKAQPIGAKIVQRAPYLKEGDVLRGPWAGTPDPEFEKPKPKSELPGSIKQSIKDLEDQLFMMLEKHFGEKELDIPIEKFEEVEDVGNTISRFLRKKLPDLFGREE